MRIIRFETNGRVRLGVPIDSATAYRLEGAIVGGGLRVSEEVLPVDRLLAPLVPTDILCIGLNYAEHAKEGGFDSPAHPMLFIKASNTLNDPGEPSSCHAGAATSTTKASWWW